MQILFILFDFYPNYSANTLIVNELINALDSRDHNVSIIVPKRVCKEVNVPISDNVKIYWVNDKYFLMLDYFHNKLALNNDNKIYHLFLRLYYKILHYFSKFTSSVFGVIFGISMLGYDILKFIKKYILIDNFDIIFTISEPFECQKVGVKILEKRDSKVVPIMLDPYSKNATFNKLTEFLRVREEKNLFEKCCAIITTNEMYAEYKGNEFKKYISKIYPINYVNLKPKKTPQSELDKYEKVVEYIDCIYTGTLYKDIRNPSYMLDFFTSSKLSNYRLILICNITDKQIKKEIDHCKNVLQERLIVFNSMNKSEIDLFLQRCNILINIGNSITNQIPSKIFDYMSLGKPIVNFYSHDNDPSLRYFEKYPLVLNINQANNKIDHIDLFTKFCETYNRANLSFEEATKDMGEFRSENTLNEFISILFKINQAKC